MKYTIGIPAYKGKFLKECIDSILVQTFTDFELIIVNDASPDALDDIINAYSDNRISYYKNERNFGAEHVVDNWNKCLSYAKGEYFVLMGDDDRMEPDYLEEFTKLIDKYPGKEIYHCRTYIINENSQKVLLTPSWPDNESIYDNIWHRTNSCRIQFISDFVYCRESLINRGGFYKLPLAWLSDDISAYLAMQNKGIAHTNKPIFSYRRSSITISQSGNPDLKMQAVLQAELWFQTFLQTNLPRNEVDKILCQAIIQRLPKYIMKQRLNIIVLSLQGNLFKNWVLWLKNRKRYSISKSLLFYSLIELVKRRW